MVQPFIIDVIGETFLPIDADVYTKEKAAKVDQILKELHAKAKKKKLVSDASFESSNTPIHEQGSITVTI